MSTSRLTVSARLASIAAIPLLLLGLAACSPGPTGPQNETPTPTGQDADSWQLQFAQCMRDAGIDYKDPGPDGMVTSGIQDEAATKASAACVDKLGPPPAPTGGVESPKEIQQQFLEAAKCLRENGFDAPDPKANEALTLPEGVPDSVLETCGLPPGATGAVAPRQ